MVAEPSGRLLVEAPALEESLCVADLEAEGLRRARTTYPLLRDENLELVYRELGRIRRGRFGLPGAAAETDAGEPEKGESR